MTDTTLLGKKPARKYMQRDRSEKKAEEKPKVRSEAEKRKALYGEDTAPDGSHMSDAELQAEADFDRDVASGAVTPDGKVTKKYGK